LKEGVYNLIMAKEKLIKEMNIEELEAKLVDSKQSLFNYRFQKSLQQLEHPEKIKYVKREIARIKTFIRQRQLSEK
tara:strand:- start:128 stop:355 length:228 start_codon:yes stop_codon:yes gene_type:complete